MTNDADFLAAILARPDDDLPRLVYADWLEEGGQDARAKVIRDQCADPRPAVFPEGLSATFFTFAALNVVVTGQPSDPVRDLAKAAVAVEAVEAAPATPGVQWVVARGFVAEVRLPLAAFLGGQCERCEGRGQVYSGGGVDYEDDPLCPRCKGDGRTHGLAAGLFAAHPITRVSPTDRTPFYDSGPRFGWLRLPDYEGQYQQSVLPGDVWRRLAGETRYATDPTRVKWFPSEPLARESLSNALVQIGRERAAEAKRHANLTQTRV